MQHPGEVCPDVKNGNMICKMCIKKVQEINEVIGKSRR